MHEILALLPSGSRALDLGCRTGSFEAPPSLSVIRADLEPACMRNAIACNAAALPFRSQSFHAVICNNSLEHFEQMSDSIREIVRVLRPGGYLYIAVPDSSTFTDRLYRWLARGGGHVNQFANVTDVPGLIAAAGGPALAGTRVLCTSLAFLNPRNRTTRAPRKMILLANGNEGFLRYLTLLLRYLDRILRTRTCIYGWAYYFGGPPDLDPMVATNVCVKCGSASPSWWLDHMRRVARPRGLARYFCPACDTLNFFTHDRDWQDLH